MRPRHLIAIAIVIAMAAMRVGDPLADALELTVRVRTILALVRAGLADRTDWDADTWALAERSRCCHRRYRPAL